MRRNEHAKKETPSTSKFLFDSRECDRTKKMLVASGSCFGAFWICFWARSLDTVIGCLCFTLGVIVFVASWIAVIKDIKKNKKDKENYERNDPV